MLVLKDHILDVPVMSLQTGEEIAKASKVIIDPRYLSIIAFYCTGPRLDHNPSVLHIDDIREFGEIGYIVDSAENLMSPDDLVRLKEVIGYNFELIGKQVIEETGRKVGKVTDYAVDNNSFHVMQLHVTPTIWKAINTSEVLISRQQIIEINDKAIIVKSPTVVEKDKKPVRAVVDNPFRRQRTAQPEIAQPIDQGPA